MSQLEEYFNQLYRSSGWVSFAFQFIPIIVGLWKRKYLNKPLLIYWAFYLICFIINIAIEIFTWAVNNYTSFFLPFLKYWKIDDTNFTAIFGYLAHFGMMGYFYFLVFKPLQLSKIVKWVSITLFVSALVNYLFIEGYNVYGVFNPLMDALYGLIFSLIFMWILFNQIESKVILNKNPYFWISLRSIIPNVIALFLFFAGDKMYKTDFILFTKVAIAKNFFFVIGHIFVAIAFYYARYTKYLPKSE